MAALRLEYEIASSGTNRLMRDVRTIESELERMSKRGAARENSEEKARLRIIDQQFKAEQKALAKAEAEKAKARAKEIQEEQRAAKAKERIEERSLRYRQQVRQRYFAEQQREREKADRAQIRERELLRRGTSNAAKSVLSGTARTLGSWGTAGAAALGLGSTFAAHNAVSQYRGVDSGIRGVANAGYVEGGPRSREQLYDATKSAVYDAAKTGTDPQEIIAGMQAILAKTGSYDAAMNIGAVEQLATATRTAVEDMATTFGSSFRSLMETNPNLSAADASKQAMELARAFAGQGKFGAVEVSDVARQGGKLIGSASRFAGDRQSNIQMMGTMVQQAVIGGATTAEDAATAVKTIPTDLMHAVRLMQKNGAKIGEAQLYTTENGAQKFKSLKELLPMIFEAAKGSQMKLFGPEGGVFGAQSLAAITPFLDKWSQAGGGAAGAEAVRKIFDEYAKQTMSEKEVTDSYAFVNKGAERQSTAAMTEFNKELGEQLGPELTKLTPKLKELIPAISRVTQGAIKFADFVIENPLKGLGVIIGAAFAKELAIAGISKVASSGIDRLISIVLSRAGGGTLPVPPIPGGSGGKPRMGGGGLVGLGLGAAAIGAGLFLYNEYSDSEAAKAHNAQLAGYGAQTGTALNGTPEQAQAALARIQGGGGFTPEGKAVAPRQETTAKIDDQSVAKIQAALVSALQSAGGASPSRTDPILKRTAP